MTTCRTHADDPARWFVLHTRSRQEKVVSADLGARHVTHYLPLREEVHSRGRRTVVTTHPVFPGYVFVHGHESAAYPVDRNRRLVRIIDVADQDRLAWELHHLRQVLDRRIEVAPHRRLRRGIRVEVRTGPLKGVQGIVESLASPHRLVLQIDMLGKATAVEVDTARLEPVLDDRHAGVTGAAVSAPGRNVSTADQTADLSLKC